MENDFPGGLFLLKLGFSFPLSPSACSQGITVGVFSLLLYLLYRLPLLHEITLNTLSHNS